MNGEGLFSATSQRSFAYHGARSKIMTIGSHLTAYSSQAEHEFRRQQTQLQQQQQQMRRDQDNLRRSQNQLRRDQEALQAGRERLRQDRDQLCKDREQLRKDREQLQQDLLRRESRALAEDFDDDVPIGGLSCQK